MNCLSKSHPLYLISLSLCYRLWNRFKEFENIQRIRDKVEILVDMNSNGKVDVDSLQDSQVNLLLLVL